MVYGSGFRVQGSGCRVYHASKIELVADQLPEVPIRPLYDLHLHALLLASLIRRPPEGC